jgi:hypothetical protein
MSRALRLVAAGAVVGRVEVILDAGAEGSAHAVVAGLRRALDGDVLVLARRQRADRGEVTVDLLRGVLRASWREPGRRRC